MKMFGQYRDSVRLRELVAARNLEWLRKDGVWGWYECPSLDAHTQEAAAVEVTEHVEMS